ncbi:unknown [Clostridium sp. CAG:524]|nr:unknown [Clostridium sp. CAG:524]
MKKIDVLENELYGCIYTIPRLKNYDKIWSKISSDKEILKEAITITRDKFDENDTVVAPTICYSILFDYEQVDKEVYEDLVRSIYSNRDIARIVMDGASNGGNSFLLMTLWNQNLKLTEEQKAFAVDEAMNKIGTVRYQNNREEYNKALKNKGISDKMTINIPDTNIPIGLETYYMRINYLASLLSTTQAHGTGEFDIRFWILRNPNWSNLEKEKLVYDFWYDEEDFKTCLIEWKSAIINEPVNFKDSEFLFETFDIYECTYQMLLEFYKDKETADRIYDEIEFCKTMRKLRERSNRKEFIPKKEIK